MNMIQKILIDIEENKSTSYAFAPKDGKEIQAVLAGKDIVSIPENELDYEIYKLLKEKCDVIFCTNQTLSNFSFYPVPAFVIFAVDSEGNYFGTIGTIGGIGDIVDDDYPVGYVNSKGGYGKMADSLKEFLELVTFYPYWRDIIGYEEMGTNYDINTLEMEQRENNSKYLAYQNEIA